MARIQRAVLSVTDKTGLVEFARKLSELKVELVSTGGTARLLRDSGIQVKDISELTGFPEMMDGRVKTLHPKVHGGILHVRNNPTHVAAAREHGIQPIDMVVVNLYAFEKTASKPGVHFDEVIENIDIGGPSMVRSAAKNFKDVAIVTSPDDYGSIAQEMSSSGGELSLATRWRLAQRAFATTAAYDSAIASTLAGISLKGDQFARGQPSAAFPSVLRIARNKRILIRKRPCIPMDQEKALPMGSNFRAKSSPITTLWTCRRPGTWRRNLRRPSASLLSIRIHAAQQPVQLCGKLICARWKPIRSQLLAA